MVCRVLFCGSMNEVNVETARLKQKNPPRAKYPALVAAGLLLLVGAQTAPAAESWLAFRAGCAMPLCGGATVQTLSTNFGTNAVGLPFTGTTTYAFYSAPLSQPLSLTTRAIGGGVVCMRNTGRTGSSDFSVTGSMAFFDYDPSTGINTLIADTGASRKRLVHHTGLVNWELPSVVLASDVTIPAGHMIHVDVTVTLVSGGPVTTGELIYNGGPGSTTAALFPQKLSAAPNWVFNTSASVGRAGAIISIVRQPDGSMLISCAGLASTTYSLEASTSLDSPSWTPLSSMNSDADGLFSFTDWDAGNYPCCYYRTATAAP